MDAPTLSTYIDEAQTALESFLTQLLNRDDISLTVEAPDETTAESAQSVLATELAVGADNFALQLPETIVSLLAEAILGQPMEIDEPGADDLVSEMTGQGYGAVRTQLAELDAEVPDVQFTVSAPEEDYASLPADSLWELSFTLNVGDDTYTGLLFLEQDSSAAAAPDASPADPPTAEAPQQSQQSQQGQPQRQPQAASQAASTQSAASGSSNEDSVEVAPADFSELGSETLGQGAQNRGNFEILAEVELDVRVELGRRKLPLADVLQMTSGSVIELEKLVGEPLSIYANGRFIAEGEAVVIDEKFGVRITNLAPEQKRSKALL